MSNLETWQSNTMVLDILRWHVFHKPYMLNWTHNIPNSLVHAKNLHCETGWYTSEMSLNCIQILGRSPGFTILQTLALHPCYVSLHNRMGNVLYTAVLPRTWMLQHVLRLWKWKHLVKLLYKFRCIVWTATVNFTSRCSICLQASEAIRNAGNVLYSRERRQEEECIH